MICNKDGYSGMYQSESVIKIKAVPNLTALNLTATALDNILEKYEFIYSLFIVDLQLMK